MNPNLLRPRRTRAYRHLAPRLAALSLLGFAAAGTSAVAGGASAGAATHRASVSRAIPPGTVLRVGDQLKGLSTVLHIGHEDQNFPYQVQYSEFVGGPSMLQAFEGGALDVGFVQSTPLIFAQAAGQKVTAVAGWANSGSGYAVVTAPGVHGISSWAGLKGKRVAFQEGTALESAALEGLKSAGLTLHDITPVNLPATQIAAALQGSAADAGIEVEPLLSAYLQANPTARVIARPASVTERSDFLVATSGALGNRAVSAALADYISRLVKAYAYENAHPQMTIQSVYEGQYGLSASRAAAVSAIYGPSHFFSLPGAIAGPQQNLANLYAAAGTIPTPITVGHEFDPRFDAVIASAQRS
jgi:sulfonate transport system substrate-binding protein